MPACAGGDRGRSVQPASLIDKVRDWVAQAKRVVLLTGAGISTESGIPDFRGPR